MSTCRICGSAETRFHLKTVCQMTFVPFSIWECESCRGFYLNDPPLEGDLEHFYENPMGESMRSKTSNIFDFLRRGRLLLDFRNLERRLPPRARILDLGAGSGSTSLYFHQRGFDVQAVDCFDASRWLYPQIPYLKANLHGSPFSAVNIDSLGKPDAIVVRHVLEHLMDPQEVLATLRQTNAQYVLVIVPNADSFLRPLLGQYWNFWDPPRHVTAFRPSTVAFIADRTGFRVAEQKTYGLDEGVSSLWRYLMIRFKSRDSRFLNPLGMPAALSSVLSTPFSNAVLWSLLERQ